MSKTAPSFSPRKGMTLQDVEDTVADILDAATLDEKVAMMSGQGFVLGMLEDGMRPGRRPYQAGGRCDRLGVPALWYTDGPRGVIRGNATCFPASMARGASWDRSLERRIGEVMGIETRAGGCNVSGAVCVNLLRHPAWGRAQETYGEDPYHVGEMGVALTEGLQTHNVLATVKHFAVNSIENTRFTVDVRCDERTLREVYLPHFKKILDAGCASVMSAYNKLNGEYCGQSAALLTDILRNEWGFEGFVHSDWILGVYKVYGASAGLDVENPEPLIFGRNLIEAVEEGHVDLSVVDTACRRILTTLYRFASAEDPLDDYGGALVASPRHVALALEAAGKSAVLLKNDAQVLPLSSAQSVGLFGRLAAIENTGDHGSSSVFSPYTVTAVEGFRMYLGEPGFELSGDESDIEAAARAAASVDAAIVVAGLTGDDEGEYIPADIGEGAIAKLLENTDPETAAKIQTALANAGPISDDSSQDTGALGAGVARGGDRDDLHLPTNQVALIKAVAAANPKTVVVLVSGSAIVCAEWVDEVPGILQTFYAGMEGGKALAHLLFGDVNPSGKLPFTVAADESHYPPFDSRADRVTYGPLHGYSLLASEKISPQFPFGFGLSYTEYSYRSLKVRRTGSGLEAQVCVKNDGEVAGEEIVQLYVKAPGRAVERPAALLKGFEKVFLAPGEQKMVRMHVPETELKYWDVHVASWRFEAGTYEVFVGPSSDLSVCLSTSVEL